MRKSKNKVARKTLFKNIEKTLIKELKDSTSEIVKNSKKLNKLIKKEAKKLVKKISKSLKINKSVLKSIDRPSVPRQIASTPTSPEVIVTKRVRTRPSEKVPATGSTSANSAESAPDQGVKKKTAPFKAKVSR